MQSFTGFVFVIDRSLVARNVNLSVFFDSCLSSEHYHQSSGDRLLSADPHSIRSELQRDKRFSCGSSERRLIGVNCLRSLFSLFSN
jgi:hypothetical protein